MCIWKTSRNNTHRKKLVQTRKDWNIKISAGSCWYHGRLLQKINTTSIKSKVNLEKDIALQEQISSHVVEASQQISSDVDVKIFSTNCWKCQIAINANIYKRARLCFNTNFESMKVINLRWSPKKQRLPSCSENPETTATTPSF